MKNYAFCHTCNAPFLFEQNDTGIYEIECPSGHKSSFFQLTDKFDVLFNVAISALNKGFYVEAIVNFATSLERFYNYCSKAILYKQSLEIETIDLCWKQLNRSERQLGSFVVLYLGYFKEPPPVFNNTQTEFRNSVVHSGKIPTFQKAFEYGEYVYNYIFKITKKFNGSVLKDYDAQENKHAIQEYRKKTGSTETFKALPNFDTFGIYMPFERDSFKDLVDGNKDIWNRIEERICNL